MNLSPEQVKKLLEAYKAFEISGSAILNFNAGPTYRSEELRDFLHMAQFDASCIVDTARKGIDILSLSHRDNPRTLDALGIGFERDLLNPTIERVYELYNLSRDEWLIFFVPGGATQMFDVVAQNFGGGNGHNAFIDTGDFSQRFGNIVDQRLGLFNVSFSSKIESVFDHKISNLLVTANATVEGYRVDLSKISKKYDGKVILDFTSNMFTEHIDWSRIKMAFGSTTKMLGTSGSTLVIVRKSELQKDFNPSRLKETTNIANLEKQANANGLLNTPPVDAILAAYYQTSVIKNKGGIDGVNAECKKRSKLLYNVIEDSNVFYKANVEQEENRSMVNVVFSLETEELWSKFLDEAENMGITGLKGHKNLPLSIRASMYLDTPYQWAEILAGFMIKFFQENRKAQCSI